MADKGHGMNPIDQIDALCAAIIGPCAYDGVRKLNRIADYCSDQCLIASTRNGDDCEMWARVTLMLQDRADQLDLELVTGGVL